MNNRVFRSEELERLPIFPLPRVVFFPGAFLPLHVFEDRYRAMVRSCLDDGSRAMAVARLKPGYEDDYEGRPEIHPIAGAGRIVDHHENPDGTHEVVLQGITRVTLTELPPDGPFRLARAVPLKDTGSVRSSDIQTLIACATQVAAVVRELHPDFELGIQADDDASRIIDTLADRFVGDADQRQVILETLDLGQRCDQTLEPIADLLASLAARTVPS